MKLTPAEYKLIAESEIIEGGTPIKWLIPEAKALAERMCAKKLLRLRDHIKGYVVATALGKRSHARGK